MAERPGGVPAPTPEPMRWEPCDCGLPYDHGSERPAKARPEAVQSWLDKIAAS